MKSAFTKQSVQTVALGTTLLLLGCASGAPKLVTVERIPVYGADPLYHTMYTGSDQRYHYFAWNRGLRGGQVKVERAELSLSHEFPRGQGTAIVKKTSAGTIDVIILKEKPDSEPVGSANAAPPHR